MGEWESAGTHRLPPQWAYSDYRLVFNLFGHDGLGIDMAELIPFKTVP